MIMSKCENCLNAKSFYKDIKKDRVDILVNCKIRGAMHACKSRRSGCTDFEERYSYQLNMNGWKWSKC